MKKLIVKTFLVITSILVVFSLVMLGISIMLNANGSYGDRSWDNVQKQFLDSGFSCYSLSDGSYEKQQHASFMYPEEFKYIVHNDSKGIYYLCNKYQDKPNFIFPTRKEVDLILFKLMGTGEVFKVNGFHLNLE